MRHAAEILFLRSQVESLRLRNFEESPLAENVAETLARISRMLARAAERQALFEQAMTDSPAISQADGFAV